MLPKARTDGVLTEPVEDELIVYDRERHLAHRLNATAALVWRNCDGQRTIAELARLVSQQCGQEIDEDVTRLALLRLNEADLLAGSAEIANTLSRRAAVRRLARMSGIVLLPVVTTIVAPTPADTQSAPPQRGRRQGQGRGRGRGQGQGGGRPENPGRGNGPPQG
jgi:hypothetical protein